MNLIKTKQGRLALCGILLAIAFVVVCVCTAFNGTPLVVRMDGEVVTVPVPNPEPNPNLPAGVPVAPVAEPIKPDARVLPESREIKVNAYHTFVRYGEVMDEAIRADLEPDLRDLGRICGHPLAKDADWIRESDTMYFLKTDAKEAKNTRNITFTFSKDGVLADYPQAITDRDRDALESVLRSLAATLDYPLPERVEWIRQRADNLWLLCAKR